MRMNLAFDADGFEQVRRRIQAMKTRSQNVIPAWGAFLGWWADENLSNFVQRGKRWRTPWKPLRPRTVQDKIRKGYPLDPLIRTYSLLRDLAQRPLGFERLTQTTVEAGTRIHYARYHQTGTRRMARRALVNARQVTREAAAGSAIRNWIVDGEARVDPTEVQRG